MTKKNKKNDKETNSATNSSEETDDDTKEKTTKKMASSTTTASPKDKKKTEDDESDEVTDRPDLGGDSDKLSSLLQSNRRKKVVQNQKIRSNRKFLKNALRNKQKKAKLILATSTPSTTTSTVTPTPFDQFLNNHLMFDLNKKILSKNTRPFDVNAFTDLLEPNVHYNHNLNHRNPTRFGTRLNGSSQLLK